MPETLLYSIFAFLLIIAGLIGVAYRGLTEGKATAFVAEKRSQRKTILLFSVVVAIMVTVYIIFTINSLNHPLKPFLEVLLRLSASVVIVYPGSFLAGFVMGIKRREH